MAWRARCVSGVLVSLCVLGCGDDEGSLLGEVPSVDDALLDELAQQAFADCMEGRNAGSDPYRAESCQLLNLLNADRAMLFEESGHAPSVQWNEDFWELAVGHSIDMCERDFFGHTNPDGESSSDRAAKLGFTGWVGENIFSWPDVASGHYAWMNEPTCKGHRAQILDPQALSVGIGVTRCNSDSGGLGNFSTTANFEIDFSLPTSPYCDEKASTYCRIPAQPVSTASCTRICQDPALIELSSWGC